MYKYIHSSGGIPFIHSFIPQTFVHHLLQELFLPGEFHRQRSLAGYSPWGLKELDMTERPTHTHTHTHTAKAQVVRKSPFLDFMRQCQLQPIVLWPDYIFHLCSLYNMIAVAISRGRWVLWFFYSSLAYSSKVHVSNKQTKKASGENRRQDQVPGLYSPVGKVPSLSE